MPKVDAGTSEQTTRESGEYRVTPLKVADDIIEAKDGRPPALKMLFKSVVSDAIASYSIPIGDEYAGEAKLRLKPFTDGEPSSFTEAGLRQFIAANMKDGPFMVRTWGDYIQAFNADLGKHIGYLADLRMTKKRNMIWFTLQDLDGFESDFPVPWKMETRVGSTPAQDFIGGEEQKDDGKKIKLLKPSKGPFPYLCRLGLDWNRWLKELEEAPALFPGHYDEEGVPMEPYLKHGGDFPPPHDKWCYFGDMDDLTPELHDATIRHGLRPVKWNVVDDPKYGLGVERGQFYFDLVEVEILGGEQGSTPVPSRKEQEYQKEIVAFEKNAVDFTRKLAKSPTAEFMRGGRFTDEGREVALHFIKPLLNLFPEAIPEQDAKGKSLRRENGEPVGTLPPSMDTWVLDGLVALNVTLEKLVKLPDDDALFIEAKMDSGALTMWVAENVPEWTTIGRGDEIGEVL